MKYLARQPILNRSRELFAYELLFRNGIQDSCEGLDLEMASNSVLDTSYLIGFEKITGGHRMFINCPRDFLLKDYISIFTAAERIITLQNMKKMEDALPTKYFIRVHKSYIVSINKIDSIERSRIFIGEKIIPVGDTYRDEFFKIVDGKNV